MTLNKQLIVLVGPPGSGKTTYCKNNLSDYLRISQDDQGSDHWEIFEQALSNNIPLLAIDRMNFNVKYREEYIILAKEKGYRIKIINFSRVPYDTCLKRVIERENHPTIEKGDIKTAKSAITNFFYQYGDICPDEADEIIFI